MIAPEYRAFWGAVLAVAFIWAFLIALPIVTELRRIRRALERLVGR